jgi:hypothetical protein
METERFVQEIYEDRSQSDNPLCGSLGLPHVFR